MNSFTRIGLRSRFLLVLMIGLILPTLSVWGQNATITGKVVDPKGEPLVGVSVLEQGTTNGTVTDMNGRYSIVVQKDSSPLRFINLSLFNCFPHCIIECGKCKYFIENMKKLSRTGSAAPAFRLAAMGQYGPIIARFCQNDAKMSEF